MQRIRHAAIASLLLAAACSPKLNPEVEALDGLNPDQKQTLAGFLSEKRSFRPATDMDCRCDDDIKEIRQKGVWEKPIPDFHPYLRLGDFNHDGKEDFAVILIARDDPMNRLTAVFNGPFPVKPVHPAWQGKTGNIDVIAYGSPPDNALIIGPLYSEGCVLVPKGAIYSSDCSSISAN